MSTLFKLTGSGVLFAEDFDLPEEQQPEAEPEVIEPVFDQTQVEAAKSVSYDEGYSAGRAALLAEDAAGLRQAVSMLAAELEAARDAARLIGEQAAEGIARLLLAALGKAMPELRASHGDAEAKAVVRLILPGLGSEPEIRIRVSPHTMPALMAEIATLDPDAAARIRMVPTDAMAPGDVRITWRDGSAGRDGAALWREVEAILVTKGLIADGSSSNETNGESGQHDD